MKSTENRYLVNWIIAWFGWTNMWWKAGAPIWCWSKSHSAVSYTLLWETVQAAVTAHQHPILSVLNYDTKICDRDPGFQVLLNLQVRFQLFDATLFRAHRIQQSWKNSEYSLNPQCQMIFRQLHTRIAVNLSTLRRQIQHRISPDIQGWKDGQGNIKLMYHILRHGSRIPGLPEEYRRAFPRSGMKFRHTSMALSSRVLWSQIWHHMHIPFNGHFWQATTH